MFCQRSRRLGEVLADMDLRELLYFEAVARNLNFTSASKELHISQPSITLAIKKLEAELDVELFVRNSKHVELSEAGNLLLQRAEHILKYQDETIELLKPYSRAATSTIRFGTNAIFSENILPFLHKELLPRHPNITLDVTECRTTELLDKLKKGNVDIIFVMLFDEDDEDFRYYPVLFGELNVAMSSSHPLSRYEKIPITALKGESIICQKDKERITDKIEAECMKAGFRPRIVARPAQVITSIQLIRLNQGISFVCNGSKLLKRYPDIVLRPFKDPIRFEFSVVLRKEKTLSKAEKNCIEVLKEIEF